jgi:hypothetical protein
MTIKFLKCEKVNNTVYKVTLIRRIGFIFRKDVTEEYLGYIENRNFRWFCSDNRVYDVYLDHRIPVSGLYLFQQISNYVFLCEELNLITSLEQPTPLELNRCCLEDKAINMALTDYDPLSEPGMGWIRQYEVGVEEAVFYD